MTLANKITLSRILLIPVFVWLAVEYTRGTTSKGSNEALRYYATAVFAVAAVSDALDGWVARRFNQQSKLGVILDPLADKLLVLSAVGVLAFSGWPVTIPLWFAVIIFAREIFSTIGAFVINHFAGKVTIVPHWTGKVSTFFAFVTISLALLCHAPLLPWVAAPAAFFACASGAVYTLQAAHQIQAAGHGNPEH
ncbi:CDP-alcohol phosphatidyltransferase family protein [Phragmitibacter flavus]|uniref:CDP-diacylglycerol--glycerol-3-phosphate 3-phosphatidyltransferase n=1 Tax=Phragmitibacter flavus TaxID=2576071 RepID=A0A5R8KGZ2_9BACT|nr:CDP-alcohol phosphatidyltransferase family protein [Phragmitibacter flavus]TLD71578.1 CDP-alcohol phosphatidyltransferase family protein [Phragmitibacter flavus]